MDSKQLLSAAEACKPAFVHEMVRPAALVRPVPDPAAFQGWRMETVGEPSSIADKLMTRGDSFILDFGVHTVGQLQLDLVPEPAADAPTRLKITFGEVPAEVAEPFDPYDARKGTLSRSWLQDETVNIDVLPQVVLLPRRYAFRYVKIEVIDTAPAYRVRFVAIAARTTGSADPAKVKPLPDSLSQELRAIDDAAVRTLRNCMQTVFEDGPKRDRRLWLGDLRLQALANYVSFGNMDLVKRCLYLFAALPREDGLVNADMYEHPTPHRGNCSILDYSALFGACVRDYVEASGDKATGQELWPTVRKQLKLMQYVNAEGLFVDPGNWWLFIDWQAGLHKSAAIHGVLMYSLQQTYELAKLLGREAEVPEIPQLLIRMRRAARKSLFDESAGVFISGPDRQISWASQAWLILGQAVDETEAAAILKRTIAIPDAVRPAGAYLYHHVVHAMLIAGMKIEAIDLIKSYWGEMIKLGATTFWEVFDSKDQKLSPYHNHLMNSYCHAWSCTPTWFIRKFLV